MRNFERLDLLALGTRFLINLEHDEKIISLIAGGKQNKTKQIKIKNLEQKHCSG